MGLIPDRLGVGFSSPALGLPFNAVITFTDLALVDRIMAIYECALRGCIVPLLLAARNTSVHRLLSLPAREGFNESDGKRTDLITYEISRIACIMYSNAILLGLPPHNGWHRMFVERLRTLLELVDFKEWAESAWSLLTWACFVGGIASYRTPHRRFFESFLRNLLLRFALRTWRSVRERLEGFIWADGACEHGAAVLWDAMDLEGYWPR